MIETGIHERLASAVGNRTFRHLSEITGTNHETIRRYIQGQAPSVEFLASLARSLGINAHWLLTGVGPMWANEVRAAALREADAPELMTAMAQAIETLITRVDRIERYVQTLELRLRHAPSAQAHPSCAHEDVNPEQTGADHEFEGPASRPTPKPAGVSIPDRARRIADAVPQRSSADDR